MNPEFEVLKLPTEDTLPEEVAAANKERLLLGSAIAVTTLGLFSIAAYVAYTTLAPVPTLPTAVPTEDTFLTDAEIQDIRRNLFSDASGLNPLLSEEARATAELNQATTYVDASGAAMFTPSEGLMAADLTATTTSGETVPGQTTSSLSTGRTVQLRDPAATAAETTITSNDSSLVVVGDVTVTNTDQVGDPIPVSRGGIVRHIDTTNNVFTMGYIGDSAYQITVTPQTQILIGGHHASLSQLAPDDIVTVVGLGYETSVNMEAATITVTGVYEPLPLDG